MMQGFGMLGMGTGWLTGILVIAAIVWIVVTVTRNQRRGPEPPVRMHARTPTQILEERYARGDLSTEEFNERLRHLNAH